MAIYTPITVASKKDNVVLEKILYTHYLIWFKINKIKVLINSDNKVNAMTLGYTSKLGLKFCPTNIKARQINGYILETLEIVLASFQVEDKLVQAHYFQETFLFTDTNIKIVLEMLFLVFNNINMLFSK